MRILKVKVNLSTVLQAQTDSISERASRTLEEMLKCFISHTQKDWDRFLPVLELAYNNCINDAHNQQLFLLEYGHHPVTI